MGTFKPRVDSVGLPERPQPGQTLDEFCDEVLEILESDRQTPIKIYKGRPHHGDVNFSGGKNFIMQPVYHSLNFRDKKRPA